MSVRPTQTKFGYTRRSRQPYPFPEQDPATDPEVGPDVRPLPVPGAVPVVPESAAVEPVVVGADSPEAEVSSGSAPVSRADRMSLRAARRSRRNLAVACGLLVAVCLVLTILIVNMARNRPSGLDVLPRSVPTAVAPAAPDVTSAPFPSPNRDAPASEGGNR